uniref:Uncharacterized protein n=1 Tax=Triticum urartu TaxID=4572 RepID=A0A8R7P265_TRIUA
MSLFLPSQWPSQLASFILSKSSLMPVPKKKSKSNARPIPPLPRRLPLFALSQLMLLRSPQMPKQRLSRPKRTPSASSRRCAPPKTTPLMPKRSPDPKLMMQSELPKLPMRTWPKPRPTLPATMLPRRRRSRTWRWLPTRRLRRQLRPRIQLQRPTRSSTSLTRISRKQRTR